MPGLHASQVVFYVEGRDQDCQHHETDDDNDDGGPTTVRIGTNAELRLDSAFKQSEEATE